MSSEPPRTVWVTGATSGIGQACARILARKGHKVIAVGRRTERLQELGKHLPNDSIHTVTCDVQNIAEVQSAFASLPLDFSKVDSLVNNAGLMLGVGNFEDIDPAHMQKMVMTNCMGVLNNTSVLLDRLRNSGRGHIVNITSTAAFYPYITGHVYAATKAFVEHFGANLRTEVSKDSIRVTNIAPGKTNTEFHQVRAKETNPSVNTQRDTSMLEAETVAEAIVWALEQPPQVSIHAVEMMHAGQSLSFR